MAGKNKIIQRFDRGLQYYKSTYIKFAEDNGIKISTTEQYDLYENVIAERVNRALKYELKLVIKKS